MLPQELVAAARQSAVSKVPPDTSDLGGQGRPAPCWATACVYSCTAFLKNRASCALTATLLVLTSHSLQQHQTSAQAFGSLPAQGGSLSREAGWALCRKVLGAPGHLLRRVCQASDKSLMGTPDASSSAQSWTRLVVLRWVGSWAAMVFSYQSLSLQAGVHMLL